MLSGNVILFTPRMWLYWILINDSLGKSRLVNSWKGNLLHSGEREASGYFRQWGSLEELFPSPGNPWWFQRKKLPHWVQSKLGYIGQPIQHVRVFRLATQKIRMLQILTSYTAEYATCISIWPAFNAPTYREEQQVQASHAPSTFSHFLAYNQYDQ